MELTNSFSIILITVVTVAVFIEGNFAALLPEQPPDLPTAQPQVPPQVPVPPVPPQVPVPPVPPQVPVPPVPHQVPVPPAPLLHPPQVPTTPLPNLPQLSPAPLPHPPQLSPAPLPHPPLPFAPSVPVPSPPDTPCYPALLTCKNTDANDPSHICCQNLEIVYKNGTDCICKVLKSSELSTDLGLDAAEISNLLVECKITENSVSLCAPPAPPPSDAKILTAVPSMCTMIVVLIFFFML